MIYLVNKRIKCTGSFFLCSKRSVKIAERLNGVSEDQAFPAARLMAWIIHRLLLLGHLLSILFIGGNLAHRNLDLVLHA